MKVVSLNIELNCRFDTVIPFLIREEADVICLQEVLEEDVPMLSEKLGMNYEYKAFTYEWSDVPSHSEAYGKRYGVAIFSKHTMKSGYVFYTGSEETTSIPFEKYVERREELESNVLVWAEITDSEGAVFRFITTHFYVTHHGESSPRQLATLPPFFAALDTFGEFILCGDFNAPRGNETFTKIKERYIDNIPLTYQTSIDQNLHRVKGLMYMVDGLFTTPAYRTEDVALVDGVSDHMAIVATIQPNNKKSTFSERLASLYRSMIQ